MLRDALETANVIGRLQERGVGFALDDFGTGYSSLSYLVLLHPRIIKIDQSFVRPSHESVDNDTLLETIISLGQKLGMTMLGEGIETRAKQNGCVSTDVSWARAFSSLRPFPLTKSPRYSRDGRRVGRKSRATARWGPLCRDSCRGTELAPCGEVPCSYEFSSSWRRRPPR